MSTYYEDKKILLDIIKTNECLQLWACTMYVVLYSGVDSLTKSQTAQCPLMGVICRRTMTSFGLHSPVGPIVRSENYIEKATELYVQKYGKENLFEELL